MAYKVYPGKLHVSRSIGDIEAKAKKFDGNPKVIIPDPDIYEVKLKKDDDFILLACDGLFERATNDELIKYIFINYTNKKTIHENTGNCLDSIVKLAAFKETEDSLSAIMIGF